MNKHLSQDQISRLILGQSSPEEEEHGLSCPKCRAELIEFRESVSTFQNMMRTWSEGEIVPKLPKTSDVPKSWFWLRPECLRWAMIAAAVVLAVLPIYKLRLPETGGGSKLTVWTEAETDTVSSDVVQLMQEVTAHLSRPLPMPMERVMALLPEGDASILEQSNTPEGEVLQ